MNIAKGYLTYGMAFIAVIYGVGGFVMGWHDAVTAQTIVWTGLAVFGLRRAIK